MSQPLSLDPTPAQARAWNRRNAEERTTLYQNLETGIRSSVEQILTTNQERLPSQMHSHWLSGFADIPYAVYRSIKTAAVSKTNEDPNSLNVTVQPSATSWSARRYEKKGVAYIIHKFHLRVELTDSSGSKVCGEDLDLLTDPDITDEWEYHPFGETMKATIDRICHFLPDGPVFRTALEQKIPTVARRMGVNPYDRDSRYRVDFNNLEQLTADSLRVDFSSPDTTLDLWLEAIIISNVGQGSQNVAPVLDAQQSSGVWNVYVGKS